MSIEAHDGSKGSELTRGGRAGRDDGSRVCSVDGHVVAFGKDLSAADRTPGGVESDVHWVEEREYARTMRYMGRMRRQKE